MHSSSVRGAQYFIKVINKISRPGSWVRRPGGAQMYHSLGKPARRAEV